MKSLDTKNGQKILLYVHFNKYDKMDDYVVYQLQQMRLVFDTVVFISNSRVSTKDKSRIKGLYDKFIQRENVGFDFAAWRDAMNDFGWDKIVEYDELTVMNDTCFGPIHDFRPIYRKMQAKKVDFWGMTVNIALKGLVVDSDGRFVFAPAHIQSYYMTFNKRVFKSSVFQEFWKNVVNYNNIQDVIINYEIRLTDLLISSGFTCDAYYNAKKYWKRKVMTRRDVDISATSAGDMTKYNPGYTCTRPLWLLNTSKNYPFIKTKAITLATAQVGGLRNYIISNTPYPVDLIDKYVMSRFSDILGIKEKQIIDIQNSRTYRLGVLLATPIRFIRRLNSVLHRPKSKTQ